MSKRRRILGRKMNKTRSVVNNIVKYKFFQKIQDIDDLL